MKTVLIIGGGVAGLTSAYLLSKSGFKIKIAEAANESGGRITALFDSKSGEMIDNGQHALMTAYHTFLEMLTECGATDNLIFQKNLDVKYLDTSGKFSRLFTGYAPGKVGFALGFLFLGGISLKSKMSIIKLMDLIGKNKTEYENRTCLEFLTCYKQGNDAIAKFWEPFIISTMNCSLNKASAEILVNILYLAFIKDLKNSKLILPSTDLLSLLKPVEKKITDNGGEIIKNFKITGLLLENNKCVGIESSKGEKIYGDYIISTLPPYALKKIIPVDFYHHFKYLEEFEYSPIISVYLWMDTELMSHDFVAAIGTDIQWIFNRDKLIKGRNRQILGNENKNLKTPFEKGGLIKTFFYNLKRLFLRDISFEIINNNQIHSVNENQNPQTPFEKGGLMKTFYYKVMRLFNKIEIINQNPQTPFEKGGLMKTIPQSEINKEYKYSYSITISSADNLAGKKQSEILEITVRDLKRLFPNFKESSILHHRIITEKFATFLDSPTAEKIRPNPKTAIEGFFLAGDWTNTHLPATIESAALSGKTAANIILKI